MRYDVSAFASRVGWGYFPLAFVGRLPFAMMIVGILTVIATVRGSVAEAGVAAACAGIGTAIIGPTIGSLADRFGERRVLLAVSAVSVAATALFLTLVVSGAPFLVIAAIAAIAGGTTPQVAPFSRSRLVKVARTPRTVSRRQRAVSAVMSYESAMDEASFVLGPVLVGVLTTFIAPWAPLAVGALLTAVIIVTFALHPTAGTAPTAVHRDSKPGTGGAARSVFSVSSMFTRSSVFSVRILVLSAGMLAVGTIFGTILTGLTAFMEALDAGEQTGIVYGAMSIGAIIIAGVAAVLSRRFTLSARWLAFGLLAIAGAVTLVTVTSLIGVIAALFLSGCGVGAVLVTLFSLGAEEAPEGRSTTVLTTLQSALVVGQALAAAVGGFVAQQFGSSVTFWVTVGASTVLVLLAVVYRRLKDVDADASGPGNAPTTIGQT